MRVLAWVLACVVVGGLLGLGADRLVDNGPTMPIAASPTRTDLMPMTTATPTPAAVTPAEDADSLPTRSALRALVRQVARRHGGRVQAAIRAERHEVAAASSGSTAVAFRQWSVSKAITAVALLRAHGWGARPGDLPADTAAALENALVGSGDCAQRQMAVELQELSGGIGPAARRIRQALDDAGARAATVTERTSIAGTSCRAYLRERSRIADPTREALQLGTNEWTVGDAARFALALGDGTYPRALTRKILAILRRPKRRSDDPFANGLDVTTAPRWGAGVAFGDLRPAYKAGWGGSSGETPTFVNEQVIFVETGERRYGIAVTFEPPGRPVRDDPALTAAPAAFDELLRGIRAELAL